MTPLPTTETAEQTVARYERALRTIKNCTLDLIDFADWVQCVVEDVLNGEEAACPICGTIVHEGPCVSEDGE